jgi:hypothetical protein
MRLALLLGILTLASCGDMGDRIIINEKLACFDRGGYILCQSQHLQCRKVYYTRTMDCTIDFTRGELLKDL